MFIFGGGLRETDISVPQCRTWYLHKPGISCLMRAIIKRLPNGHRSWIPPDIYVAFDWEAIGNNNSIKSMTERKVNSGKHETHRCCKFPEEAFKHGTGWDNRSMNAAPSANIKTPASANPHKYAELVKSHWHASSSALLWALSHTVSLNKKKHHGGQQLVGW